MSLGSLEGNLAMIEFELDLLYLKRTIAAQPASPTGTLMQFADQCPRQKTIYSLDGSSILTIPQVLCFGAGRSMLVSSPFTVQGSTAQSGFSQQSPGLFRPELPRVLPYGG